MRFLVTRTSLWSEERPCEEAKLEQFTKVEEWSVDDPQKLYLGETWYRHGVNHRVENGKIKRDFHVKRWFVEINTLEELLAFMRRHGRIILHPELVSHDIEIEIYDVWRD